MAYIITIFAIKCCIYLFVHNCFLWRKYYIYPTMIPSQNPLSWRFFYPTFNTEFGLFPSYCVMLWSYVVLKWHTQFSYFTCFHCATPHILKTLLLCTTLFYDICPIEIFAFCVITRLYLFSPMLCVRERSSTRISEIWYTVSLVVCRRIFWYPA